VENGLLLKAQLAITKYFVTRYLVTHYSVLLSLSFPTDDDSPYPDGAI